MKHLFLYLLFIVVAVLGFAQKRVIVGTKDNRQIKEITGRIVDNFTNEALIGVNLYFPDLKKGYTSDEGGRFFFELPEGVFIMDVSFVGYKKIQYELIVEGKGTFNIRLMEDATELGEIVISSRREDENVKSTDLGKEVLSIGAISSLPAFVGEVDVLKSLTLLPGISTPGEASGGFNVRGGGTDQNLILLGNGTLYNPSHFFGFFSSFNSDLVRDVSVYKGGIPANYGGRASSIIDIQYRDGDYQKWSGQLSAGLISSKIVADGPIINERMSILIGARVSYANWFLKRSSNPDIRNSKISFYDGNVILNYLVNEKSKLTYSYYNSYDQFNFVSDTAINWRNQVHTLTYNTNHSERLFSSFSVVRSQYDFGINSDFSFTAFDLSSQILDDGVNAGLEFKLSDDNIIKAGVQSKLIRINPGTLTPLGSSSLNPFPGREERALESGVYFNHEIDIAKPLKLSYGLRYSFYQYLGPNAVYSYDEFQQRRRENVTDSLVFGKNQVIENYGGFEPRISLRATINNSTSVKIGYNRIYQYIQLISNTTSISPTDIWKLSDSFLQPAQADQYSAGIFKNFANNTIETSIEAYYKQQNNLTEYKDGAELFLNRNLETELLSGRGKAYGIEFYVKKNKGRSRGWVSYTYSRSLRQVIGQFPEETINNGEWFKSNFDKPHDLTAVYELRISPFVDFSSIFTYSTGRPTTYPLGKFRYAGETMAYFENRNEYRMPDYHRLDLSLDVRFNAVRKIFLGEWKFSVYNFYGRNNAYSLFFNDAVGAPPQAYKLAVLADPFLSVSYTIKI